MSAIISLPLVPALTTGFPREKYLSSKAHFTGECMKSISGCFSALHHKLLPSESVIYFSCSESLAWCRDVKNISVPHPAEFHPTQRPYMNLVLYWAVTFFTRFVSTEEGQRSEREHRPATESSLQNWPCTNPDLKCAFSPHRRGNWGRDQVVGQPSHEGEGRADRHNWEGRKSTERTMWGGWGLAPVFTHHAIPLPGHSNVHSSVPTL